MMRRWDFSIEGTTCNRCEGKGQVLIPEDCHRSEGWIPCTMAGFQGHGYPSCVKGKLSFSEYDRKNRVSLMRRYPPMPDKISKKLVPGNKRKRKRVRVKYSTQGYPL